MDLTDVFTGWTELAAVPNKAQVWVFEAIQQLRQRLPFALVGLDSDNGSEFINNQRRRYCEQEQLTMTRSRPHRKNDNCFVEQKNYSVVRRYVGYARYDTPGELALLNQLYEQLQTVRELLSALAEARTEGPSREPGEQTILAGEDPLSAGLGVDRSLDQLPAQTPTAVWKAQLRSAAPGDRWTAREADGPDGEEATRRGRGRGRDGGKHEAFSHRPLENSCGVSP